MTRPRYVTRECRHPRWLVGHSGDCSFDADTLSRFQALMQAASSKRKGSPALVSSWDDGRGSTPWYSARCCPDEIALRDRVAALLGVPAITQPRG